MRTMKAPPGRHREGRGKQVGGNVSAPGIFFDPCPTSGLLGGALGGRT